jgi:hypothetical protein
VTSAGRGRGKRGSAQPEKSAIERSSDPRPCGDDVGTAAEARVRHRRGELRALRFCGQGDRQHRGAGACVSCAHGRRAVRGQGGWRSGIGREPCCVQVRCGGIPRIVQAAKDTAHPGMTGQAGGYLRVGHPREPRGAESGRAELGLGGALSFLYFAVRPPAVREIQSPHRFGHSHGMTSLALPFDETAIASVGSCLLNQTRSLFLT